MTLVAAIAMATTVIAQEAPADATPDTCDEHRSGWHIKRGKAMVKAGWAKRKWRDTSPVRKGQKRVIRSSINCLELRKDQKTIGRAWGKAKRAFYPYSLYRHMARFKCGFSHARLKPGKNPADGQFYGLDCRIVCGESGGHYYPPPNAIDGYGQWIASSWSRWVGYVSGKIERRLERRFKVKLTFGARAGYSSPLEQHVIAWASSGKDTWYGYC